MNKKRKKIILLIFLILISGCAKNDSNASIPFTIKYAELKSSGWNMYIDIEHNLSNDTYETIFNGYSFEQNKIEKSYARITKNNVVVKKLPDKIAYLSNTDKYKDDVLRINQFFKENNFNRKIKMEDLGNLNIASIRKNDIMRLYNRVITQDDMVVGSLINVSIPCFDMIDISTNQDRYMIYYYIVYGNIENFYIDYTDYESFLSDKKVLNDEEIQLRKDLDYIEKIVKDNNSFNIKNLVDKDIYIKYSKLVDRIGQIDDEV